MNKKNASGRINEMSTDKRRGGDEMMPIGFMITRLSCIYVFVLAYCTQHDKKRKEEPILKALTWK